jgi:hypothetical protein
MQPNILRDIHEGMKVYDSRDHEIGKVEWVQHGADNPSTPDLEASSTEGMDEPERHGLLDDLAAAFRTDDLPEEIRQRLLMQGFVRIDAEGLFAADRYVTPDQIAGISDDRLRLSVEKSELMKRQ